MSFASLGLSEPILKAVEEEGYLHPTPIQLEAIPPIREGKDILGCAQTGTGKTAAFALPILDELVNEPKPEGEHKRPIRTLVLSPTRELAVQIGESFENYGRHTGLRSVVVYGGVSQRTQVSALRSGVDIVVATPGRLLDLIQQRHVDLRHVTHLVLDEADRMLDMGFIDDVREIISRVPRQRQTLFFSATMPPEIQYLADNILTNPVTIHVSPQSSAAETVDQSIFHVERLQKPHMLVEFLKSKGTSRVLVFTRTKQMADRVTIHLNKNGVRAEAIHGDKNQKLRERAMESFKAEEPPVLVATDIASRGLDIDEISHVVNYEVPNEPEVYIHRIGRTGRAGAEGWAVSFVDIEERALIRAIEKMMKKTIRVEPVPSTVPSLGALLRGERPVTASSTGADGVAAEGSATTPPTPVPVVHKYGGFGRNGVGVAAQRSKKKRRR